MRRALDKGAALLLISLITRSEALAFRSGMTMQLASIETLKNKVLETEYGVAMRAEEVLRESGNGSPHRTAKLRLFGSKKEPRVTYYRDSAIWCVYCQKVSCLLEEKKIPHRTELINMRSYGTKPSEFLGKVPGGLLPAIELDGQVYTESLDIMALLDDEFRGPDHRTVLPERGTPAFEEARQLLAMERTLFRSWCDFVFRGSFGSKKAFERDLKAVDKALETGGPEKPFFFGAEPGLVDMQYFSHLERIFASVAYWKGEIIRGNPEYPNINAFFDALEKRPSYAATRSDFYTNVRDIPPQYGDGVIDRFAPQQPLFEKAISGADWNLPLQADALEVKLQPGWEALEPTAHLEALYKLVHNFHAVAKFSSRPAGEGVGKWSFARPDRAKLADPVAKPADGQALSDVEAALTVVANVLHDELQPQSEHAAALDAIFVINDSEPPSYDSKRRSTTATCLIYLRDRVGVPRDMSFPAARAFRATLGWAVEHLQKKAT